MPAGRPITRGDIFAGRQIGIAVNGDAVIVPKHDEIAKPKMPGKPDGLVVNAFHQAAIARDDPSAVINKIIAINGI